LLEEAYRNDPVSDYLLQMADHYEVLAREGGDHRDYHLAVDCLRQYLATETNVVQVRSIEQRIGHLQDLLTVRKEPPARAAGLPVPPERKVVPVEILSDDDALHVAVGKDSCETPCLLHLVPGVHSMVLNSDDRKVSFTVPEGPGVVRLPTHPRKYLVTGIVLTALGTVMAGTFWTAAYGCMEGDFGCVLANLIIWPIVGGTLLVTGIGYLGYYGTHQISKVDVDATLADSQTPRLTLSSIGFQPLRNGGAAGVRFSF
jgi:hypothetical protein